ncbi:MAG: PIN domain-containing protein [Candidatus Electrothrix sp. AUS4]|nr:PIN domain-containing protein [Candidatus Electrothrix sp. AUS4]
MKIYLDACCFNRPFDDQRQNRIHLESEAIILIMDRMHNKEWEWVGSDVLIAELEDTPDIDKRRYLMELAEWVHLHVELTEDVIARATELEQLGLKSFDAMHVACAESAQADVFLTTDDKLLKTAQRERAKLHVTTANPLSWLTERV